MNKLHEVAQNICKSNKWQKNTKTGGILTDLHALWSLDLHGPVHNAPDADALHDRLLSGTCVWNWYSPSMVWYVILVFQRVLFCCFLEHSHLRLAGKGSNLNKQARLQSTSEVQKLQHFALFLYQFNHFDTQDFLIKNSSKPGDLIIFECHTSRPQQCCFFSLDHRGQLATAT